MRKLILTLACLSLFAAFTGGRLDAAGGALTISVGDANLSMSVEELRALPQVEIVTSTDWTDGPTRFSGPLARDVLALAGAVPVHVAGADLRLVAANDYAVTVPTADFERYDVILALEMNNRLLSLRDRGPVWVIYPLDEESLHSNIYASRMVWQLTRIESP